MRFFNPDTNEVLTSGQFFTLYGRTPTLSALQASGFYPFIDPLEDYADASIFFEKKGIVKEGSNFYQMYIPKVNLIERISLVRPIGQVSFFASLVAPAGWLPCDGTVYDMADAPELGAYLGARYGGDGVTTFAVPDLRGQFLRGFDGGAGVDPGRVFGSTQADELAAHDHYIPTNDASAAGSYTVADLANQTLDYTNLSATSSTGGTETRPTNVALLPCIRY